MSETDHPDAPAAPDADRVNTYAEAIRSEAYTGVQTSVNAAYAVIALADREQATVLARIARIEDGWRRTNAECIEALNHAEAAERALADERANRERALTAYNREHREHKQTALAHLRCERALADERAKVALVEALRDWWRRNESSKTVVGMTKLGCAVEIDEALAGPTAPEEGAS